MKKITVTLVSLVTFFANAQIVTIPDANFKAKLLSANTTSNQIASAEIPQYNGNYLIWSNISHKIDINNDGEIQLTEAQAITRLTISYTNIIDLTGIENFTSLIEFSCEHNFQITSLNLIGLSNLHTLFLTESSISNLNLTGLTNLKDLYCGFNNQLTSLNVSGLTNLQSIHCYYNQLTSLDVSGLTNLQNLWCNNNQLTTLNIKNNSNEIELSFSNNPNLQYVCADASQLATVQQKITEYGYTNCQASSTCEFLASDSFEELNFNIYPNPANEIITINIPNETPVKAEIFDLNGRLLQTSTLENNQLNISHLKTGNYFVKIFTQTKTGFVKMMID